MLPALICGLVLSVVAPAHATEPILVSAAISLTDAVREVAKAYAAAGGGEVRFNLAASNALARQIVSGAPVDLFISADEVQMAYAVESGAIDRDTVVPLLRNRLAVVVPAGRRGEITDVQALTRARRVAIGDPAGVPVGVYARRYLQAAGVWTLLQPKLVPLPTARAVLAAATSGGVDAAMVYESDLAIARGVELGYVVNGPHAPEIVYPAGIVMRSGNKRAAGQFLSFLMGPEAQRIFERHRFCRAFLPSDEGPPASGPCASRDPGAE